MRRVFVPTVALLVMTAGSLAMAGELKSGLQIGEGTQFYLVNDCTGPNAGTSLCYR
jgi:uncharacterized phage protein gp47/JayE